MTMLKPRNLLQVLRGKRKLVVASSHRSLTSMAKLFKSFPFSSHFLMYIAIKYRAFKTLVGGPPCQDPVE